MKLRKIIGFVGAFVLLVVLIKPALLNAESIKPFWSFMAFNGLIIGLLGCWHLTNPRRRKWVRH